MSFGATRRRGASMLTLAVLLGGALLLAPAVSAQEAPDGRRGAAANLGIPGALATGGGITTLPDTTLPEKYIGDRVVVTLAAHMRPNQAVRGSFAISHREPTGELVADVRGQIECLRVEGEYAVTIGTITGVNKAPDVPDEEVREGMVAAIVVQDSGSNDTMAWRFGDIQNPSCDEIPAETNVPVEAGNFVVLD